MDHTKFTTKESREDQNLLIERLKMSHAYSRLTNALKLPIIAIVKSHELHKYHTYRTYILHVLCFPSIFDGYITIPVRSSRYIAISCGPQRSEQRE